MENEKRTGIQLSNKDTQLVSLVDGGIKIAASEKPVLTTFKANWGWVYMLLDSSYSMKKNRKLDLAIQGVIEFAQDALRKQYRVGFIKFSDEAELLSEPVDNVNVLQNKIKGLKANGGTNLTEAIISAHDKLKDLKGVRVIVIATDGMPDNVKSSLKAASIAKSAGIDIISIGTDDANQDFLNKLASKSELSSKVSNEMFAQAISNASRLLAYPKSIQPK